MTTLGYSEASYFAGLDRGPRRSSVDYDANGSTEEIAIKYEEAIQRTHTGRSANLRRTGARRQSPQG